MTSGSRHRSSLPWTSYWITGASSGIGAAVAEELSRAGTRLVLSGRSEERLAAVAEKCRARGATVEELAFDIGDAGERARAIDTVTRSGVPDALINNAGLSQRGTAAETDTAVDRRIMEVDYLAAVELTKAVLPAMLARRYGLVVAVSSIAGFAPVPLRSSYNAAKAAQVAFFGTLSNELVDTGVQVRVVIPGFVRTRVSQNALTASGTPAKTMDPNQAGGISPQEAARAILAGLPRRNHRIFLGMGAKLWSMYWLSRMAPRLLDRALQRARVR